MSAGSRVLRVRSTFSQGLRVAFWRDIVRPRILHTAPMGETEDNRCEIHVMTSAKDWIDLIWALKSFYRASGRRYALCIHDDGTLMPDQLSQLHAHFPSARIITRKTADEEVLPTLARYPRCLEFRRTNRLAPKVFDFAHYLRSDRMMLLDSDVLFFAKPEALLRRIEDSGYVLNAVNGDVATALTVTPEMAMQTCGVKLIERFNSGLGLIHKASLNFDWLEEFLGIPGIIGYFWRIEQTLFALCSSRWGGELLPPEYDVRLSSTAAGLPSRHYVGAIRHLLYTEGIPMLIRRGIVRPPKPWWLP